MATQTVTVCSHGEIVQTGPYPDTRIWHTESQTFCTDRPECLKSATAMLSIIPGTVGAPR